MKMQIQDLHVFLEEKHKFYNCTSFINQDPICIPHLFSKREDIEIAGFLAATLAWGRRNSIIKKAKELLALMGNTPYDFVLNATKMDVKNLSNFTYRTFNGVDCVYFIRSLQRIYSKFKSLEDVFIKPGLGSEFNPFNAICSFRSIFFNVDHQERTCKHIANPAKQSAAKRLNLYLRWMVRNDNTGVDFGIWDSISPASLICPLDVHAGNVARKLGLLTRTQNDWKAAQELTANLKKFDPRDPVKYDFALFGLGIFEKF